MTKPIFASLVKISGSDTKPSFAPLRTKSTDGFFYTDPKENQSFVFYGISLSENADLRMISTSPVKEIEQTEKRRWVFTTHSSTYELSLTDGPLNQKIADLSVATEFNFPFNFSEN